MKDDMPARNWSRRVAIQAGAGALFAPAFVAATTSAAQDDSPPVDSDGVERHLPWTGAPPDLAPARTGLVELGDLRLWVSDSGGSGEPVVFFHPGSVPGSIWKYQQPVFSGKGYRVILWSRRGYNGSEAVASGRSGQGADGDDLLALLGLLGIDRFHGVGAAAGGITLLRFAIGQPDRLLSVTLAGTMGGIRDDSYAAIQKRLMPDGFEAMPLEFRELSPGYRAMNPDGMAAWLREAKAGRTAGGGAPPLPATAHPATSPVGNDRMTWKSLEALTMPLLIMTGDADIYMPPAILPLFTAHAPHARTEVIDGAAHATYWEQPEQFNQMILGFLNSGK
ncbi:MAG: alpha/beta hydrolase [Geminicoccaceae bacterium]